MDRLTENSHLKIYSSMYNPMIPALLKRLSCMFAVSLMMLPVGTRAQSRDLVQFVNTLQGTHSTPEYSSGNTYPATALPFGMHFWSPQTGENGNGWKYQYQASSIRGFGLTHQCSPWMNDYGVFSLMPEVGTLQLKDGDRASAFQHKNETAKPDYYKVQFDNGITTEISPTVRGAGFQISFPKTGDAFLVFDGYTGFSDIQIHPKEQKITGYVHNGLFIPGNFKNYFVLTFDQPLTGYGTYDATTGTAKSGSESVSGDKKGAYLKFKKGIKLNIRIAASYISARQADITFSREVQGKTFDQLHKEAHDIWNKELHKIVVEGGQPDQMATFYSCLYHASLFPCRFFEYDADNHPVYYSPNDGKLYAGYFYTDEGYWDTFRAQFPLNNITQTKLQGRYMQSILAVGQQRGWLPSWSFPGETGGVMIGNHAISLLADAWVKGIHSFNPDTALKYYLHEALGSEPDGRFGRKDWASYFTLGYIPDSKDVSGATAKTLEYCYDDFCGYMLAKLTNNKFYEKVFARQLYNYRNVFNPETGFMQGKDSMGNWTADFNPYEWGNPFVEGNSWHYTWSVFHDVQGLIDLMGGNKKFTEKIDALFAASDSIDVGSYGQMIHEMREMVTAKMGQYAQGNEPIEHLPYLYNYAGQPWKTQKTVRMIMDRLYSAGPEGYPGDEDEGQMASWYVLSALGIYSVCPGTDQYVIGSPVFKKATIHLENGNQFVIDAKNNTKTNVYINAARLNNSAFSKNYLTYKEIMQGGKLELDMSDRPNTKRGTAPQDYPYSLSNEVDQPLHE